MSAPADAVEKPAGEHAGLSEFEKQRAAHIRRNMEYLARLGLADAAKELQEDAPAPKKKREKKAKEPIDDSEKRRSARLQGVEAEMPEGIDMAESTDDDENPRPARRRGVPPVPGRDIIEDAREWLAQTRKALLELPAPTPGGTECRWQAEAVRRWGDKVACSGDWETFLRSRLSTPPPPSPHQLLQEFYAVDPWQLLCACSLMSRVSSHAVKHNAISGFFERFPTPSSLLDANPEEVQAIIHPLGLFPTRMQTLVAITRRFLEAPLFNVGLEPELKVYGVGAFGVDSYRLFCRGDLKTNPEDKCLKSFVEWQRRNAAKKGAGGDAEEEPASGVPASPEAEEAGEKKGKRKAAPKDEIAEEGGGGGTGGARKRRGTAAASPAK